MLSVYEAPSQALFQGLDTHISKIGRTWAWVVRQEEISKNVKKSMYINVFYEENLIIEVKCIIEFNTSD